MKRYWRQILAGVLLVVVVLTFFLRPSSNESSTPPPAPPVSSAVATQEDTLALREKQMIVDQVFALEQVLDSPPSAERSAVLTKLCTPAGYASLGVSSTHDESNAGQAEPVTVIVERGLSSSVLVHDFDEKTVWVQSTIVVSTKRGRDIVNTFPVTRLSYWEKTSDGWKFIGFEKSSGQ
ncbi:hypothetical protein IPM09_03025 [Candidatus Saccharibacteria bacterium]|nr:MAG: hypothetical protein IPM09_03025 [Candidatus Saccharibacteria bacterium]